MDDDVLVLWDIDGTLLNAGGVGRDLYDKVFAQLFGRSLDACAPMAGRTDRAIILETLTLAGVAEPRRYVDPFISALGAHAPTVRAAVAERGRPLPGATEALAALVAVSATIVRPAAPAGVSGATVMSAASASGTDPAIAGNSATATAVRGPVAPGTAVGVPPVAGVQAPGTVAASPPVATATTPGATATSHAAVDATTRHAAEDSGSVGGGRPSRRVRQSVLTGNVRLLAEVKLAALGLRDRLDLCIGAYGDDHEDRAQLVEVARRRAAAVHGRYPSAFAGTLTVVIGDTPLDVSAALSAGARAVGVATGPYSAADLRAAGAHAVLPSLADTALVLKTLLG
jgi:phosphoglycolate phosphatase-like HAD superfamily hydrolase